MLQQKDRSPVVTWLKVCLLLFLSLFIWQLGVEPARADTWTICQSVSCDFSSIQTAVDDNSVTDGDTLSFTTARETYEAFTLTNKALTFQGNDTEINADESGSVITIVNGSKTVSFDDFRILDGSSGTDGGGIQLTSGNLTLTNVMFNNNDAADQGGALYIGNGNSTVTLDGVTIAGGTAVSGGAIYNNGTLNATNLTFTDNNATNGGGLYNNSAATLDESAALRNAAVQAGGGVFNASGATLTLQNSDLANNDAADGAGIANDGTLQITGTNIGSLNAATQAGGGIYNIGQATLLNSTVVQNQAVTGAGIYNDGTLTANNSTFSRNAGPGNQPAANGPGLYNQSGTATLNNVTLHLTNGTSIFANGGTVEISNTIISSAGNSGLPACDGEGAFTSDGYNLASDQSCTFLTEAGDIQGLNPDLNQITSPADGAAYHSPKITSPVINAGNPAAPGSGGTACLLSDQRGLARPQNGRCDIGAVEIVVYRLYTPAVIK